MKNKINDVLMWIPIIGFIRGILSIFIYNEFYDKNLFLVFFNGLYQGYCMYLFFYFIYIFPCHL